MKLVENISKVSFVSHTETWLKEISNDSWISSKPSDVHILVPGAGLGRLAFEIAKRGYTCQGNEFSLFMLFASNFVLNK